MIAGAITLSRCRSAGGYSPGDGPATVTRRLVTGAAIVLVALVALSARLIAVERLPIDFDEDDYLRAGQQIATGLQEGDPGVVIRDNYRPEHPPLTKVATGLAIAPLPPRPRSPTARRPRRRRTACPSRS